MSNTNSVYSSSSRVTGMFSNFDTDTMVKNMCSRQQSRIDKQEQQKTSYEWYNETVTDVLKSVKEFSNTYCSALGNSSMLKSSTYSTYVVTTDSESKAVKITASDSADTGSISIKVNQLAENAHVSSIGKVSADGTSISPSNTAKLSELSFKNKLKFSSDGKISFAINGKSFSFSKDTSLQNMINTINNDADANVTMKYSRLSDSFTITADSGGKNSKVSILNIAGNAFGENSAFQINNSTTANGQNSIAEINGNTIERESNKYSIDNIYYEFNDQTVDSIKFNVERDYSATTESVSKFVEAFNTMLTKLNTLVNEKDYSDDFPPLTKAQEDEMSEDQVKKWNEKAKSGVLRHNSDLEKLISSLRESFFTAAGSTGKSAASIGISSPKYNDKANKGLLIFDKDDLTAALKANPEEVLSIFTGGSSTAASTQQGVIYKIRNTLSAYQKTADDSVSRTDDKIDDIKETVEDLEDKLESMASRYYKKFADMETALSKLNSQSSYISQLFA